MIPERTTTTPKPKPTTTGVETTPRLSAVLAVSVAMALLGSLLEFGALAYRKLVEQDLLFLSRDAVWWIPLTLVSGGALIVGAAWLIGSRAPAIRRPAVLAGIAASWALYSPLLVFHPRLHAGALLLIAVGLGSQVGRLAGGALVTRRAAVLRSVAALTALIVVLGLGVTALERRSRLEASGAAGSPPAGAWNVLVLVLDTVRAIDLSLYGYPLPTTPSLEALAPTSVVFDHAIAPSPWTLPTHGSLFTGRWPSQLTVDWQTAEEPETTTLAEVFRASGYRTAGFSANVEMLSYETGLAQGFETFEDRKTTLAEALRNASVGRLVVANRRVRNLIAPGWEPGRKSGRDVRRSFLRWLRREPTDRPFFAFLNFFDAHLPYDPSDAFRGRFEVAPPRPNLRARVRTAIGKPRRRGRDSASVHELHVRYAEAIASIDHEIELIVQHLRQQGQLDRTILVVTADHGELFGEQGLLGHGNSLYMNSLRVPLLIRAPGALPAGHRVAEPISLRDIPRTLLDIVGLEGREIEGASLLQLWRNDPAESLSPVISMVSEVAGASAHLPVSRGDMVSIVQDSLHFILGGDQTIELYDAWHDPYQQTRLESIVSPEELVRLRTSLQSVWTGQASRAPPMRNATWKN